MKKSLQISLSLCLLFLSLGFMPPAFCQSGSDTDTGMGSANNQIMSGQSNATNPGPSNADPAASNSLANGSDRQADNHGSGYKEDENQKQGGNWNWVGWLGLLGIFGLAGLKKRVSPEAADFPENRR